MEQSSTTYQQRRPMRWQACCTLNNEVVEKKTVITPDELRGIVKCNNPKCITNNEPMSTLFHVVDKERGTLRCHYCEKEQDITKVKLI